MTGISSHGCAGGGRDSVFWWTNSCLPPRLSLEVKLPDRTALPALLNFPGQRWVASGKCDGEEGWLAAEELFCLQLGLIFEDLVSRAGCAQEAGSGLK